MPDIAKLEKDEIVLYQSLDLSLSVYKVLDVGIGFDGLEPTIVAISHDGTESNKKFSTTMKNKKGDKRIFKCWLQPNDKVLIAKTGEKGKILYIAPEFIPKGVGGVSRVMAVAVNEASQKFEYPLEESADKFELIT